MKSLYPSVMQVKCIRRDIGNTWTFIVCRFTTIPTIFSAFFLNFFSLHVLSWEFFGRFRIPLSRLITDILSEQSRVCRRYGRHTILSSGISHVFIEQHTAQHYKCHITCLLGSWDILTMCATFFATLRVSMEVFGNAGEVHNTWRKTYPAPHNILLLTYEEQASSFLQPSPHLTSLPSTVISFWQKATSQGLTTW